MAWRAGQTWCPPGGASSSTPLQQHASACCSHVCAYRPQPTTTHQHNTRTGFRYSHSTPSSSRSTQAYASQLEPQTQATLTAVQTHQASQQEEESPPDDISPSVVRITVVKDMPRFDMPLLLGPVQSLTRTATAVTYKGEAYLLANASSVLYAQEIKVHVAGQDTPYKATVAHLCMEADLAILQITAIHKAAPRAAGLRRRARGRQQGGMTDTGSQQQQQQGAQDAGAGEEQEQRPFWEVVNPLDLGPLPALQEPVQVLGASGGPGEPQGRSASGQVACVEVVAYPLASFRLLGLSVTATIPKDRLGAPVLDRQGRCVGITFQRLKGSSTRQRRGRQGGGEDRVLACPALVVKHVLEDIQTHGSCLGFAQLGIRYKFCDAAGLRGYLGMNPGQQGVMVLDVNPSSTVAGVLEPGDVIMKLQGEQVGNDGTMAFELGGRLSITHRVAQLHVGSMATITILRGGQSMDVTVRLGVPHRLLPSHLSGRPPSYLVVGGLVLTTLSVPCLEQTFGPGWMREAPPRIAAVAGSSPRDGQEEVVVVAHCEDVKGLQGYRPELVEHQRVVAYRLGPKPAVDATPAPMQPVSTLRQLAAAVLACKDGDIRLELGDGSTVVLAAAQATADARSLLAEYEVERVVSVDMVDLLPQARPAARLSLRSAR